MIDPDEHRDRVPLRLPLDLLLGFFAAIRETWPTSDSEARVFLSGFCWAFGIHWTILILVSWLYCSSRAGGC